MTATPLRFWRPAALALVAVVALGAIAGIVELRRQAATDHRRMEVLGEVREKANDLQLIEWHALAGVQSPARAAIEFSLGGDHFVRLMRELPQQEPVVVEVNRWFSAYARSLVREFTLLRDARVASARAHDSLVDLSASELRASLENAQETFAHRASWKTRAADIITLGVLLAAAGFLPFLWRRFRLARRRAEQEAVERSERRLRALVQHGYDAVGTIDPNGRIVWASESTLGVFGVPASELVGTEFLSLVHPDDVERAILLYSQLLGGDVASHRGELRTRHGDGGWRQVELSISNRLLDPDVGGIIVNARDVTELRENEHRLRQAQRLETVGQLAGGVAHDFNNLLTVIIGSADVALARLPEGDAGRIELEEIRAASERAADLTRQLLAFGRVQVLLPETFELDSVVVRTGELLRRLAGEHIELVVAPGAGAAQVRFDTAQLEQVILDLALDARDAMPHGGTLTVATGTERLDEPLAGDGVELPPGEYVSLSVRDTGIHMDDEAVSRIFDPFFTAKHDGSGTGLGLATAHGIVVQSGGTLTFESEPGRGSVFTVLLPLAEAPAGEAPARHAPPPSMPQVAATVLVAEDEPAVRGLVVAGLERAGYTVLGASEGNEALALAQLHEGTIDLLLTDVVMPGMSGRALAERLVAERPGLPVLYTSGYPAGALGSDDVSAPGSGFLQKPFTLEELTAAVASAIAADTLAV